MENWDLAVHRTIVAVDVEGFGDRHRTNRNQLAVRDGLYRVMREAFRDAGIPWVDRDREDRGDGMFILAGPEVPKSLFVESLPSALVRGLRLHNAAHSAEERIRLRVVLHAGEVNYDRYGATAASINLAFRLLESDPVKEALAGSPGVLAFITSAWFFEEVVRHSAANAGAYCPVPVAVKETTTTGWICLPDYEDRTGMPGVATPPGTDRQAEARSGGPGWSRVARASSGHRDAVRATELDQLADLLAVGVREQWTRAAAERRLLVPEPVPVRWERPSLALAGPVSAAVNSAMFAPVPGVRTAQEQRLQAGSIADLHAVYGGLGSGRLIIAGPPGSGKSGAAIMLILAALAHREGLRAPDRSQVPVPMMFMLHGWDPRIQPFQDWLSGCLRGTYPLFAGRGGAVRAAGLLAAGKLAVILDGLDEIPGALRPVVLRALNEQGTFRLVILSRSVELADAVAECTLDGAAAVELQKVDSVAAASYLTRVQRDPAPRGWQELISRLRENPEGAMAQALSSPLTLTLVRDTYRAADDVGDLLALIDDTGQHVSPGIILDHLLGRVLPAAYLRRPGEPPPRYDLRTAERTLRYIARRMNQEGTRDLRWWHVRKWTLAPGTAASRLLSFVATSCSLALGGWLVGGVVGLLAHNHGRWALAGLAAGLAIRPVVRGRTAGQLFYGVVTWLAFGLACALVGIVTEGFESIRAGDSTIGSMLGGFRFGLMEGLLAGLVIGLIIGLIRMLAQLTGNSGPPVRDRFPRSIAAVRRNRRFYGLILAGVLAGLICSWFGGRSNQSSAVAWVTAIVTIGIICGVAPTADYGVFQPRARRVIHLTPVAAWRSERAVGLALGLTAGFVAGMIEGPLFAAENWNQWSSQGAAIVAGLEAFLIVFSACTLAFMAVYSLTWPTCLAFAQLAIRGHTPLRLMRFLEDARQRDILRTAGPVYQFRHARLQDHLARQAGQRTLWPPSR